MRKRRYIFYYEDLWMPGVLGCEDGLVILGSEAMTSMKRFVEDGMPTVSGKGLARLMEAGRSEGV